jgi:hypothetical protein
MAELSAVYEDVHDRIWEIEKVKIILNLLVDIFNHSIDSITDFRPSLSAGTLMRVWRHP